MQGKRKYLSEFAVNLCSAGWMMMPASQLSSDGEMQPEAAELSSRCHIYVICRRPSLFFEPETFAFLGGVISGHLVYRTKGKPTRIEFKRPFPLYDEAVGLRLAEYPHREIHTLDEKGEIVRYMPAVGVAMSIGAHLNDDALSNMEVLYVGQAYADGKRTAHDRLKSHSTLQRILAEASYTHPDDEIWIGMFDYPQYRVIASFDGMAKGTIDGAEDSARFHSIFDNPLTIHQQICLAEAGLIRFFRPKYNEVYKETFPSENQKILASCFELDFSGLVVEIDTEELSIGLFSDNVKPGEHHLAQFDLVRRAERASFFSITDLDGKIHTPEEIIAMK